MLATLPEASVKLVECVADVRLKFRNGPFN
jgi:hypothetical protein